MFPLYLLPQHFRFFTVVRALTHAALLIKPNKKFSLINFHALEFYHHCLQLSTKKSKGFGFAFLDFAGDAWAGWTRAVVIGLAVVVSFVVVVLVLVLVVFVG
mgnify:CR=1 FL=1